jgi:hypothetical protein
MSRRVLVGVVFAGAVGAAAMPVWRPGIGWCVSLAAILVVVLLARASSATGADKVVEKGVDRAWRFFAGVAGVALIAVPAIRAAGWLVALCVLVGVLLCSYALVGGRTWREIALGAVTLPRSASPAARWAGEGMQRLSPAGGAARAGVGFTIGAALLVVFGWLFWKADPAFADLLRGFVRPVSAREVVRGAIGFAVVLGVAGVVAYQVTTKPAATPPIESQPEGEARERRYLSPAEWAIPVVMLDVLFGVFVWVQLTVLFGGDAYVLQPGGPDYAVFARGGFAQLMVVTALTLGVVTALAVWTARDEPRERRLLRLLGGALCVLTLVIVASALKRLGLYAQAYGFTVERLLGYVTEVWLGLVFGLVIVAGVRLRAGWLPRATVAAGVGVLIGLAAINPEALMARTHIARVERDFAVDNGFLSSLSTDAYDEISALETRQGWCLDYQGKISDDLSSPDPWYVWNASRQHARDRFLTQVCGQG